MTRTENLAGSGASISLAYKGLILHLYGAFFGLILATEQQKETPVENLRGRDSRVEVLASRKWLQSTVIQNLAMVRGTGIENLFKWRHVKRVTVCGKNALILSFQLLLSLVVLQDTMPAGIFLFCLAFFYLYFWGWIFCFFSGGMENKFGLLHIFPIFDLVCRSIVSFCFFLSTYSGRRLYLLYLLFLVLSALFRLVAVGCAVFDVVKGRRNLGIVLISVTLMYTPSFSALVLPVGVGVSPLKERSSDLRNMDLLHPSVLGRIRGGRTYNNGIS